MAKTAEPWDRPNPRKKASKGSKHLSPKGKTKAKSIARAQGRSRPSLVDNMNALKGNSATKKKPAAKKTTAGKTKTATKKPAAKKTATKKAATKVVKKTATAKTKTALKSAAKTSKPKTATAKRPSKSKTATTKTATTKTATTKTATTKKAPARTAAARKSTRAAPRARDDHGARIKDPAGGLTAAGRREFARTQGSHLKPGVTKPASEMSPEEMRRWGSWAVRFFGREKLPPLVDAKGEPTRLALSAHAWGEPVPATEAEARKIADKGHEILAKYHALKEE